MGGLSVKLNSDNRELMPITDAVYGPRGVRPDKPAKPVRKDTSLGLFRRLPQSTWDAMKEALRNGTVGR